MVVVHDHLAPQAEDAFVRIDPAQRIDRTDGTLRFAEPALTSALRPAVEPVEELYLGGNSERGAQGTQVTTEEPLDKQTCRQQAKSEDDKRPVAHKAHGDRRLEGLNLCQNERPFHGVEGQPKDHHEERILDGPEAFLQRKRHLYLPNTQSLGAFVEQFL